MIHRFQHVTILGAGLLGGSLALALEGSETPPEVKLWARRAETVRAAAVRGIRGATENLADAIRAADLLILAVPVGAMRDLLAAAISAGLPENCLVSDVGSVKATPHQMLAPLLAGRGNHFIGSHPMAGSEQGGIESADAGIFRNASCLITTDSSAPQELTTALAGFWELIGCRISRMSAAAHDACVARISHLPHIVSSAAAAVCMKNPEEIRHGGGGLRDTTRVAAGNPDMWAEIITENRASVIPPLRETIGELTRILAILESSDQAAARDWLALAKSRRDALAQIR